MKISNLSIGFSSSATLTDINTYEITGDMSAILTDEEDGSKHTIDVGKIKVIYNHDGLFADTKKSDGEPDALRIFRDTEVYANCGEGTCFDLEDDVNEDGYMYVVPLHHDNALNIYAYFDIFGFDY